MPAFLYSLPLYLGSAPPVRAVVKAIFTVPGFIVKILSTYNRTAIQAYVNFTFLNLFAAYLTGIQIHRYPSQYILAIFLPILFLYTGNICNIS